MSIFVEERHRTPVEALNRQELMDELVNDALMYHSTSLRRMLPAIERIAKLGRVTPEVAFQQFVNEAKSRGVVALPMYSGAVN